MRSNSGRKAVGIGTEKGDPTSGDGDAGYIVKKGQPHYGYKAHVAVDETHTLIGQVTLRAANVHDSV
jgi:hypothetical protein